MIKTLVFLSCLLCASLVWGQAALGGASLSAEPRVTQFFSHPQHASQMGMATEQRLFEKSTIVVARGQRPLWEVAPAPEPSLPLGDIARMLRDDHETARKAERTWTN